ncbi:hypothetical protein VU08_03355 [Desulfobulbus sp. F5]|nr:hypothetical protein [Desulfobulbus sp. F5]
MRRFFSAVFALAFVVSCLSLAWAGEKEDELLKAMEAIVQQYKAGEGNQQQSKDDTPPPAVEQQKSQALQQTPVEAASSRLQPPAATTPPVPAEQLQSVEEEAAIPAEIADIFQLSPSPVQVANNDDIITTIEEAVRQYRANDFAGAISNLDYATQLIRQKKSERMKALLPEPLLGWQAKPALAKSLGTAVFGGGSTVSRDYFIGGGAIVSVEIISDSPVLQSIIMMLNNPLFAGASGGNIQTIKQQRAMLKYNEQDHSGEINIVVAGRFIVTVKGRAVDQIVLFSYAEAVDFEALAKN